MKEKSDLILPRSGLLIQGDLIEDILYNEYADFYCIVSINKNYYPKRVDNEIVKEHLTKYKYKTKPKDWQR